nr:MAG TPA: hypothetical protein [Caudoviricetes sp.]
MKERLKVEITEEMLETTQTQALAYAARGNDSSQRKDMALDQQMKLVVPIGAEYPYYQSSLMQDIMGKNSVIRRRRGKITLLHHIKHQFMNFYIYKLNGIINVLETDKFHTTNNFTSVLRTDLDLLELNKEYDIRDDEENFCLTYPDSYSPITDCVGLGKNMRSIITTNVDNASDSALVSERFCAEFTCLRQAEIKIELTEKRIISRYKNLFPDIGTVIQDDILFKIIQDTDDPIILGQNPSIASGFEDEQIRVDSNSFLARVEVYSNVKCKDENLEKFRLELLDYRHKVYDALSEYSDIEMSEEAKIYRENYKHDKFRINSQSTDYPYIKMTFYTIDIPDVGYKFSTQSGGKFTIQRIYRNGEFIDEYGRNIDCLYISQSLIARSTASPLYEVFHTGVMELLKYRIQNNEITAAKTYEFLSKYYDILGLKKEFEYIGMSKEDLYEFIKQGFPAVCYLPYTNNNDLQHASELYLLANKYIDYKRLSIYHIEDLGQKLELTSKHEVGFIFYNRQKNDPREANSSTSISETNSKGYPVEKNASKKTGRSSYAKTSQKVDILTKEYMILQNTNSVNNAIFNTNVGGSYVVYETLLGMGINFYMNQDNSKKEELED